MGPLSPKDEKEAGVVSLDIYFIIEKSQFVYKGK